MTGYISLFQLHNARVIQKKWFTVLKTTINGAVNNIALVKFDDQFAAMTDYDTGYVQIWPLASTTIRYLNSVAKAIAWMGFPNSG